MRPRKTRSRKSARATAGNLLISASAVSHTSRPARQRNSERVTPSRCEGRSTAQTSCSGTSARNACTRSGSAQNSVGEICGIFLFLAPTHWTRKERFQEEVLGTSRASYADAHRSHIRWGGQLKCQERATFALCHNRFPHNRHILFIPGHAENITVGEFFNCDHGGVKPGKKRCHTFAQFCIRQTAGYPEVLRHGCAPLFLSEAVISFLETGIRTNSSVPILWPAGRWHDTVHAQVFDHLPVMVKSMEHGFDRQRQPTCLGTS